ncbi:MAG: tyrosine-type recombinase/integrase [Anaerolineae bacterium]
MLSTPTAPAAYVALVVEDTGPLDRNPAAVYLASLGSSESRRTMRSALNEISRTLTGDQSATALQINWPVLRFQHTAALRSALAAKHSAATVNKLLCALRGVLRNAHRLGQLSQADYQNAVDLESVKGETLPAGRALTSGEIAALLEACARDKSTAGDRDGALIALLRAGGLRRAETCGLDLADYDKTAASLRVKGKRNKQREVPISDGAAAALADWLHVRGENPGPLFCPIAKDGKIGQRRLTPQAIYKTLAKRAAEAKVKDLSPHDFRRTFVSDLLDAGADIATVQKLAGHANMTTTSRYDRRGEQAKRRAVQLLHVPYRRRMVQGEFA